MAAADRRIGSNAVVEFLPTGGTPGVDELVLTADYTSFSSNRQVDTVDVTAGNETSRYSKPTIESLDFSLMMFDANQSYKADILPGATGLFTVYPVGKTSGEEVFAFNGLITAYNEDFSFDAALEIDISGERQGAMVTEYGSTYTP